MDLLQTMVNKFVDHNGDNLNLEIISKQAQELVEIILDCGVHATILKIALNRALEAKKGQSVMPNDIIDNVLNIIVALLGTNPKKKPMLR